MRYLRLSDLPFSIGDSIKFGEVSVVQLNVLTRPNSINENVFGVDQNGRILWQIPSLFGDEDSPYVGLIRRADNVVRACNWSGMLVDLSVTDGRVLETTWGK